MGSSLQKPLSCQRLCTSNAGVCPAQGVSSWAGSGRGLPTTALRRSFTAARCHYRGVDMGLLPALPKPFCLPSCWEGREYSPLLKEQQIQWQRNGQGCPGSVLAAHGAGDGWLACHGRGGNQQLNPTPNNHHLPHARLA